MLDTHVRIFHEPIVMFTICLVVSHPSPLPLVSCPEREGQRSEQEKGWSMHTENTCQPNFAKTKGFGYRKEHQPPNSWLRWDMTMTWLSKKKELSFEVLTHTLALPSPSPQQKKALKYNEINFLPSPFSDNFYSFASVRNNFEHKFEKKR